MTGLVITATGCMSFGDKYRHIPVKGIALNKVKDKYKIDGSMIADMQMFTEYENEDLEDKKIIIIAVKVKMINGIQIDEKVVFSARDVICDGINGPK